MSIKTLVIAAAVAVGTFGLSDRADAQWRYRYSYPAYSYSYPAYSYTYPSYYNSSGVVTAGYTPYYNTSGVITTSGYTPYYGTYMTPYSSGYYNTYYNYPYYGGGILGRRAWRW